MNRLTSLPRVMLICDYQFCGSTRRWREFLETLHNRDWNNELAVQVRIKNQTDTQFRELAELAKSVLPSTVRALLNGNPHIAAELGYDGVHFPQNRVEPHPVCNPGLSWISVAIHQTDELTYVEALGAHTIVVAPVFRPHWKPVSPLGISRLRTLVLQSPVPVFALGGINLNNIDECLQQQVHGVAVLSSVLKARDPIQVLEQYLDRCNDRSSPRDVRVLHEPNSRVSRD